jgi:hypothetical protein
MQSFEKLGAFYLGKLWDAARQQRTDDLLLYDSRQLTTHAVCVGMTGSGKTGLGLGLLEEAAIDGVPAIAIDPKGDLGNLLLTFPELRPQDFRPWIDEGEAARKGQTPEACAATVAETWTKGLADWGQDGARIARLRQAADFAIYTPGSTAGRPLRVLRAFDAPPREFAADADALRDRVMSTVSGLLGLLGIDADPLRSREHILLSTLLQRAWHEGRNVDLGSLIREVQTPPIERVGVMDLESFFPPKERAGLAMSLNSVLAAPGFAAWIEGEPLDVKNLLWTAEGRPRLSVVSIAHLGDAERMFFVTLLLNEIVAWMRAQPGTSSLRALLYMDEVFGYLPPTANPPSKPPMLTLLKQARAFGLGVVLATQNPVDLDYKALSNAGTWWLGRLQTERDQLRVIEGLEGAAASCGGGFDRAKIEATLAGLRSRVFLMHNVYESEPVLFETRWTMSYLRGPLTLPQIRTLAGAVPKSEAPRRAPQATASRPPLPPEAGESFAAALQPAPPGASLTYRPALLGSARLHYVSAKEGIDQWEQRTLLSVLEDTIASDPWDGAEPIDPAVLGLTAHGDAAATFAALPAAASRGASYATWGKALVSGAYRTQTLVLWRCAAPKATSKPGESEQDFRIRLGQLAREGRDATLARLEQKYAPQLARLSERLRQAEQRVAREQSQFSQQTVQTAISLGATVLGAFFGRKSLSVGNLGRATTTVRGAGRAMREREDVGRASEDVASTRQKLAELQAEFDAESAALRASDPAAVALDRVELPPRKSDVTVERLVLLWLPWHVTSDGAARPAFR